jgi:homoserine O-acetyltransferase
VQLHLHHEDLDWLVGPGGVLDTRRWFVIIAEAFANGVSSSPSADRAFPDLVTLADNVRAQRRLLREHFGVTRLAAVYGFSLGGMQAYHWSSMYPDEVDLAIVVCGAARVSSHTRVYLSSMLSILEAAPEYAGGGRFSSTPVAALDALARVDAAWCLSYEFFSQDLPARVYGADDLESYLRDQWVSGMLGLSAENLYSQLKTWLAADVSAALGRPGDLAGALATISARVVLIPCRTDLIFPAAANQAELAHLADASLTVLDSSWGHRAGNPTDDTADLDALRSAVWVALGPD